MSFLNPHKKPIQMQSSQQKSLESQRDSVLAALAQATKSYSQQFEQSIQGWSDKVKESIRMAVMSEKTNQISPKLELILTSILNQQDQVHQQIELIRNTLFSKFYFPHPQGHTISISHAPPPAKKSPEARDEEQGKGRSLSAGVSRRRLSKASCFAQAKKADALKLVSTGSSFGTTNGKLRKNKKRQGTGFKYLEKCLSSTSPSNFMLHYMQRDKVSPPPTLPQNHKPSQPSALVNTSVQHPTAQSAESGRKEREGEGSYHKFFADFQEKISHKLDQLMVKYTKIEQKMETSSQVDNLISKQQKGPNHNEPKYSVPGLPDQNQPIELERVPQSSYALRTEGKNKMASEATKQSQSSLSNQGKKLTSTSLSNKSKIIRNKIEPKSQDQSIEEIKLSKGEEAKIGKESVEQEPASQAAEESNLPSQLLGDKSFIENAILEFYQQTGKIILPISKKLLHYLKTSYLKFCSHHCLPSSESIRSIETEAFSDPINQMKDHLEKTQKLLKLKCPPEKKEKFTEYFKCFLTGYLSFSPDRSSIVRGAGNGRSLQDLIAVSFSRLV